MRRGRHRGAGGLASPNSLVILYYILKYMDIISKGLPPSKPKWPGSFEAQVLSPITRHTKRRAAA